VDLLTGIPPLEELELEGQRVLVRADLDLLVDGETGAVLDDAPLSAALPTFQHVVGRGARLVIAAHRGNPQGKPSRALTLEPAGSRLAELTGWEVQLPEECVGDLARKLVGELRSGQVCLLENLRFDPGEEQNDEIFVRELGRLADVFVADALAVLHLAHASVVGLPKLLRHRTAGLALRRELEAFGRLDQPMTVALLGGTFSAGVPLVEALLRRSIPVLVGGLLGSTLLAAQGVSLGASAVDNAILAQARTLLEHARQRRAELVLPTDVVIGPTGRAGSPSVAPIGAVSRDHSVLDIGPRTAAEWRSRIGQSKCVLWNGPIEMTPGSAHPDGSLAVLAALGEGPAFSLVGPDSVPVLRALGTDPSRFGHVTRGTEAARELLLGRKLPGLELLRALQ
jgi:phosphoglycerate kinase